MFFSKLLIPIVFAILLSLSLDRRIRISIAPIAIAVVLLVESAVKPLMLNLHFYYPMILVEHIGYAFVFSLFRLDAFRKSASLAWLFILYGWLMLTSLWAHYHPFFSFWAFVDALKPIVLGIILGDLMISDFKTFERCIKYLLLASVVSAALYLCKSSWDVAAFEEQEARMVVDMDNLNVDDENKTNINWFVTSIAAVLPFPYIYLFGVWQDKKSKWFKLLALLPAFILPFILLKTGSRNGGLAIAAVAWFALFCRHQIGKVGKLFVIAIMVCGGMVFVSKYYTAIDGEIRAFSFTSDKEGSFEQFGSGRGKIFFNWWDKMTPTERVIGMGTPSTRPQFGRDGVYNCHSAYFQIIITGGYVACFITLIFFISIFIEACKNREFKDVILFLFFVWAFTGAGECSNIVGNGPARYGLGIAVALCRKRMLPYYDRRSFY